jgi:hypothetical protein
MVKNLRTKKDKKQGVPLLVDISHDDKFIVEVLNDSSAATILMRNVV